MTRPRKEDGNKRTVIFKVRFSPAEKKTLSELAHAAGLTPSDFVRVKTIGGQPHIRKATPERAELIKLQAELNKIGGNLNQIAKAINRYDKSDVLAGLSPEVIAAILRDIKTITASMAQQLGHGH